MANFATMREQKAPFERISVHDLEERILQSGILGSFIDVCGFFLCEKGHAKVMLNEHAYSINEGDVYIYTPSTFVSLLEKSDDVEGLVVKSTLNIVLPFAEKAFSTMDIMMLRERPCFSLTTEQRQRIREMTAMLENRQQQMSGISEDSPVRPVLYQQILSLTEAFFYELLSDYFLNQNLKPETQSGKDKVFQRFMLSLMQNYKREREVGYYAGEQCLSPRYFSTIVKEVSGHTASEWIVEMVVSYASQLLLHSSKSVKEIALEFHFPNQSFFGKYFKQHTGLSPKAFRSSRRSTS